MLKAVLFDLDGTLVDTEPAADRAVRSCFAEWQIPLSEEDARYITGRTWQSAFDHLFSKYPVPLPPDKAAEHMIQRYRDSLETHLTIVPGAVDAVKSLCAEMPLCVVSGSYRSEILWALKKLGVSECFKFVLGAEDYPKSKPAPDGYLKAMQTLGVRGAESIVFEDSAAGVASGLAAGAWVVALKDTNHHGQDTSQAHHHIPDLTPVNAAWMKDLARELAGKRALEE